MVRWNGHSTRAWIWPTHGGYPPSRGGDGGRRCCGVCRQRISSRTTIGRTLRSAGGKEVYHPAYRVYSAGVAGKCRVIYVPARWYHWGGVTIKNLEPGAEYSVSHIDPASFDVNDAGRASGDAKGEWHGPILPYLHDWLIVLR